MSDLNEFQAAALEVYADGSYDCTSMSEAKGICDTLLQFILIELSAAEDCENIDVAVRRMEAARADIDAVIAKLQSLQDARDDAAANI